jgi:hypothetical protein
MHKGQLEAFSDGVAEWIAAALYVVVAIMWLVPDRLIEDNLTN